MKKIIGLIFLMVVFAIVSCTTESGDSFGYQTPPSSVKNMDSTEPGPLQQPGGVAAEIENNQGNPTNGSEFTVRE
ncbi:hypothetical protein [Francisella adeliensis]|uniref:Uncharacterized protein n=1 Tax=Francisella adeliensis TaxID=2007306 RepID=A0A2Z4XXN5_9GAMM|nr:hypothetical protein [Francisella adeliensis]AXA33212.1 hypothetical protein CDH04_01705 [Francisella adeliensis]MBK2085067.1 hypothetical protein [Francisella adeliensis]MBK2096942.1 hypothetical protein [Francisella adeliensis]QIW11440.1 hypothetical protein FZC43_01710 [Francisella adeliensis]QIW13315.1 hypothetical protein FZC44_01710 [Francisella adeliensis]